MDNDTEHRRLSPVAIISDNGYLDLINGPQCKQTLVYLNALYYVDCIKFSDKKLYIS